MSWLLLLGNSLKGAQAVRALGYELVMIPDTSTPLSDEAIKACRVVFPVELSNLEAVERAYDDCARLLGKPLAILNFSDAGQLACEWLRERYGLLGNGVDVAMAVIDKSLMRSELNLDPEMAVGFAAGSAAELLALAGPMLASGRRHVLKPSDGVGSRDIHFVADMETLDAALAGHADPEADWILEEALAGEEYSVEAVSCDGVTRILGVTKKYTNQRAVEVGHLYPAPLAATERAAIERATLKALDRLRVRWGATHTELMFGPDGARVIETHLRPGGDEIPELLRLVDGHCQYRLAIEGLLHGALPPTPARATGSAAIHFITHDGEAGRLRLLELTDGPVPHSLALSYRPGDDVPVSSSSFNRVGHVLCVSDGDDARARCLEAARRLTLQLV